MIIAEKIEGEITLKEQIVELETMLEDLKSSNNVDRQKRLQNHDPEKQFLDKAAEDKENSILNKLNALRDQLDGHELTISTKDILALQDAHNILNLEVEKLSALIDQEKVRVSEWEFKKTDVLESLREEKENLLADLAGGDNSGKERLEAISLELETEEQTYESLVFRAHDTTSGLKRKLESASHSLSIAKRNYVAGLINFLDQELKSTGDKYVKVAADLASLFMQIYALSSLLEKCGSPRNIQGPYNYRFIIPSFSLDTCTPHECSFGALYQFGIENIPAAVEGELRRLANLNINMPH
jgi:hypothetical protein